MVSGGDPHSDCTRERYDKPDYRLHAGTITLVAWIGVPFIERCFGSGLCHPEPTIVSRVGRSIQFGRASAPMIPQQAQTIRGPNHDTGTSSA